MKKTIFIILITFLLTGCYDHKELNTISILTASEINKNDDNFIVKAQIVNPQSPDKTTNAEAPYIIYTGIGKTIQEAYRQIKLQSARYIYASHLEIIIIDEELAKNDISEIIDFYLRTPASRAEFKVLIGKDNNILSVTTPIDEISASSIKKSLEATNNFLGITKLVTMSDFTEMTLNPNIEVILPSIKMDHNNPDGDNIENTKSTEINTMYKLDNLAIFKDNKLLGYLNKDESLAYNMITNNIKNSIITYPCDKNKYMSLEIITSKSDIKIKDLKPNIDINLTTTINESACKLNISNEKELNKLTKEIESYLNKQILTNINNIRNNYNSDIFGFLDIIYKHDYNTYQKVKDNWYNNYFKELDIKVTSHIKITSKGNVLEDNNEKD